MSKENITFRLDSEKRVLLDAIAQGQDRDRTYILNEAVVFTGHPKIAFPA